MTLKDLVAQYRAEHCISQRKFAASCGLSNGYISMLEKGVNPKTNLPVTPTIIALQKLATGMGMTMQDLLSSVDDMPVDLAPKDDKKTRPQIENGSYDEVESEIIATLLSLSTDKKREALNYIRYLAASEKIIKKERNHE